jgi:hypothetical protein
LAIKLNQNIIHPPHVNLNLNFMHKLQLLWVMLFEPNPGAGILTVELIACVRRQIIGWLERESARLRSMASGRHEHCLIRYTIAWIPTSNFTKCPTSFLVWSPTRQSFQQRNSFRHPSSISNLFLPRLVHFREEHSLLCRLQIPFLSSVLCLRVLFVQVLRPKPYREPQRPITTPAGRMIWRLLGGRYGLMFMV